MRVTSRRTDFKFDLHRSITIVKGDLVASHTRLGEASGVSIKCDKRCVALVDLDWKNQLDSIDDSIVFVDEGSAYITTKEFASAIQKTSNYYVLFTREDLHELPYSVDEIYRIKTSGKKYHTFEGLYKPSQKHIYSLSPQRLAASHFDRLITEDSKSGLQFYESRLKDAGVVCESAGNNAGIYSKLNEGHGGSVFVVADGAAFGSEVDRVLKLQALYPANITVCLPESFEWLLLRSGLVDVPDLADVLENTSEHVDSEDYFSWEQFFAAYLRRITQGTPFKYAKGKLPEAYRVPENAERVMHEIETGNIR